MKLRARIAGLQGAGLWLRYGWRGQRALALTYREILTAERLSSGRGIRLHTRTTEPIRVACRNEKRVALEDALRKQGVRVVDEYGAMITPTLADFEAELAREPPRLRQSSDDA